MICVTCGKPVKIDRARRSTSEGFVVVGSPTARRAICEEGHIAWPDDERDAEPAT
jgi:hypothetical protein